MDTLMIRLYTYLVKLSDSLFYVEKLLLILAVIAVVAVNFLNVCLRYMASYSLNYCETLSVVLFMFMVLLGANLAVKSDTEIKIEIIRFKNPLYQARYAVITDLVVLIAVICCLYGLWGTVAAVMKHRQRLTPLPLYTYHVYIVMLAGFVLILIDRLILFLKHLLTATGHDVPVEVKKS